MKPTIVLGLLSLMIIPRRGSCGKLNLTEEVRSYIDNYVGNGIEAFNLTGGLQVDKQWPTVTGTVSNLKYVGDCNHTKNVDYSKCNDFFFWFIYRSILTPFSLPLNLTVLYKGQKYETLPFNLSNATYVMWNPENLMLPPDYGHNYSEKKCDFSVQVHLSGKFAYQVRGETKGDKPNKGAEGIGRVGMISRDLVVVDDLNAYYNAGGVFQHTVICS